MKRHAQQPSNEVSNGALLAGCLASEGGLVPFLTLKKPTSVAVVFNWIVNDWYIYQGSIPLIHIREDSFFLCEIGNLPMPSKK